MDMHNWRTQPLSLLGRINVVIMNLLPRLNFLFHILPCYLSSSFLKSLNKYTCIKSHILV
uniref:Uncharacterized protein n=1 Tax=Anguilla anguilla TaxID=7936 RepID=A0A0E9XCP4_ANGAN